SGVRTSVQPPPRRSGVSVTAVGGGRSPDRRAARPRSESLSTGCDNEAAHPRSHRRPGVDGTGMDPVPASTDTTPGTLAVAPADDPDPAEVAAVMAEIAAGDTAA